MRKNKTAQESRTVKKNEKSWLARNITTLILGFILLLGAGLIAYPTFSDWWNSFHQSRAVASYVEAVTNMNLEEYEEIIGAAQAYNKRLAKDGIKWTMTKKEQKRYNRLLNIDGTGIMGYINIPKINVMLPIYHGIEESILQVAIGHIEGSSLPVGGRGSHCIVSGHRGLPSARLFTDLDKLTEGDLFTMTVLNYTITYEVDQIRIVEPTDLSDLQISKKKDYCTLVTCTPYGINTHRLLVRGHRVENVDGPAMVTADALQIEPAYIAPFIAAPILFLLLVFMFFSTGIRIRRKKRRQKLAEEGERIDSGQGEKESGSGQEEKESDSEQEDKEAGSGQEEKESDPEQ